LDKDPGEIVFRKANKIEMSDYPFPPEEVWQRLREGIVIPAHPLALTKKRRLDERRQQALTRYYLEAGAGGVAVGVHTTQFAIHQPQAGLYQPVLELAAKTVREFSLKNKKMVVTIAGICGGTRQALKEAELATSLGYQAGLLSLSSFKKAPEKSLLEHCCQIARVIPLFGFYLQPAVGGRVLSCSFWRKFMEIPNVVAIKVAPFNRYQTLDVVRALAESGRTGEIALYTGNDDNIVIDLLTTFCPGNVRIEIAGGLLGHWAFWTKKAVALLEEIHRIKKSKNPIPQKMLSLAAAITDCNSAVFDAANNFAGCVPGIHEVLRRQGLLENIYCLCPEETLSPGQKEEIDRIYRLYPELRDDDFVAENLGRWLS